MQEEFEDTKGVIRICISKKNGQHNDQKEKKYKRTNNDLQTKHTHKAKDRITLTPLKTKNTAVRSKIKDCLARNQDNVSKCCDMSIRVPLFQLAIYI
jgi:hypothetical protein